MTTTAHHVPRAARRRASGMVDSPVLDRAVDAQVARREAEVALLLAAVEWAETHPLPAEDGEVYASWESPSLYGEGIVALAGDGAPLVAEFAPDELAVALAWPVATARSWMGDGLELKYRLPRLFDLTITGVVPLHLARYVTEHTRDLPIEAAADADRSVSHDPARLTWSWIRSLVDEARLYHDPDRAVAEEENALAARRVDLVPGNTPATTDVIMSLDTPDTDAFDRAVAQIAAALRTLDDEGCDEGLDVRRARAVGVLADPQRALDLLRDGTDPGRNRLGGAGGAVLWLHLDESQLSQIDTFPAPVRADRLGTLSSDLLKLWLSDTTLVIRPVRDCHRSLAVDVHDPPEAMADEVRLRDPECVFPGCHRSSQRCDLDHIEPYLALDRGGPPGQTFADGLAPLCRRHHRAKTLAAWTYHRRPDGSYHWTTPSGHSHVLPPPRRTRARR